ncbi:RNA polymerase factor sigma-54 [Marinobacterium lutimaris]|uniref:RNA polymerase sigma-54 factor n=1 Tax=Marinobacterium lutimaris TaxID=568106 RepID=A0A1H6AZ15_9GAMM|nr:RNA polymerase factor sigma-54 [Marinobacterium lutimaris]SEG53859.1 RNA polymerase, sigma 54 subunit, RpoN/SigL [Marinobacterium lutimaris]
MKQSLQLKIGQQLTMTPQLQQAIRLLQLSTLDLQQEIQQALESNPLLEVSEEENELPGSDEGNERDNTQEKADASDNHESEREESYEDTPEDSWSEDIPSELTTDSSWDDTYQASPAASAPARDDEWEPGDNDTRDETLQDHLLWQLNLTPMSEGDRLVAESIIDGIEPDGYLTLSAEELLEQFVTQYPEDFAETELDEIEAVLHRVQQFDPPGVAARDLSECLAIQLRQLPSDTPFLQDALRLVCEHLQLLGNHDYKTLLRRMRVKEEQLQEIIRLIQSLTPKPGAMINPSQSEYVIPDVVVTKIKGEWVVNLNPDAAPKLRINAQYADLIRRADNSADNNFLKNHLQEARWFLKSLLSRNDTLLKVATEIVARQSDFLEEGEEAMKPMVLHDIAEAVEMHESTISRVTTQKYMHTPRGIFELKYFFSSHVSTSDGGAASSTAIRALIKKLVSAENPGKPLSDNKIAQLLDEQGINVARRTIAKYREAMAIPPSNERKRLV